MAPLTPADVLGAHAGPVRDLLVRVVRDRHDRAADAHQVSESRYANGFGTQWRDLLDDARDALTERGYQARKLIPGGYALPVVNDSLIYVWRVPNSPSAVSSFASSPTRQSGFSAPPPDPTLFEPELTDGLGSDDETGAETELERVLGSSLGGAMPLVLVLVESSPRQLHSIDWAIAVMDAAGKVALLGRESIWVAETIGDGTNTEVDAFDSGTPPGPRIEPREEEGSGPDA